MKNRKIDARRLSSSLQEDKRMLAVKMRENGLKNNEVSQIVGLSAQTISTLYTKYKAEGISALKSKKRGVAKGTNIKLSKEKEERIIDQLINTTPKQLKFEFSLWTRESVKQLIKYETGKEMPISTVGEYLRHWQFLSKKHLVKCYTNEESEGTQIKKWFEEEYSEIKIRAKTDRADIWWVSEKNSILFPINLKGYASVDSQTKSVSDHPGATYKIYMISATTNTGKSMFALYDESTNIEKFIDFMEKVIKSSKKKVYLIVDRVRGCHAMPVKVWVKKNKEKIALFYLPPLGV